MKTLFAAVCALLSATLVHAQGSALTAAACDRLAASLKLPHTTVTSAQPVTTGEAMGEKNLPPFCRVSLTLKPSSDSDIKSEVWLPLSGWNGKLQTVGNGAWGGSIQYGALALALRRGYAASSTDTGHTGTDASFALGHPEKLIDFGYRSIHETAVQSKATIAAAYGAPPRLSYFNGCSGGGRQAFMEAQRFPDDFDAIIAGAPGYNRTDQSFQLVAASNATHIDEASFIPVAKLKVIHQGALNACDAKDGVKDGIIGDPMRCQFDPEVLACKGADGPDCLTRPQVVAAKKIYAPVIDPRNGKQIFPGVEKGSEPRWTVNAGGARPMSMSDDLFKFVVFKDPEWDYHTLDVSKHLDMARKAGMGVLDATSPNIRPFIDRGGKLLIYHGWGDTNVPPRSSVVYFNQMVEAMGAGPVASAVRMYMAPGMGHCGAGEGPNVFDMVTAVEQWREHGKAPAEIIASRIEDGRVVRTRPLCPFPQLAHYKGSGSTDQAENFACKAP